MSDRTWQDNAHEFGALVRQGKDVRLALLVACSVVKSQGKRDNLLRSQKVPASTFANEALGNRNGAARVLRHLDAWDRMAKAGHVPAADTLTPADALTFGEPSDEVKREFHRLAITAKKEETLAEKTAATPSVQSIVDQIKPEDTEEVFGALIRRSATERVKRGTGDKEMQRIAKGLPADNDKALFTMTNLTYAYYKIVDYRKTMGTLSPEFVYSDKQREVVRKIKEELAAIEEAMNGEHITDADQALQQWAMGDGGVA